MVSSGSEDNDSSSGTDAVSGSEGVCNWCSTAGKLVKNKPYCSSCQERAFRECVRCKRPLPSEKYFSLNPHRCNACERKLVKEQEKRKRVSEGSDDEGDIAPLISSPKKPAKTVRAPKKRGRPAGGKGSGRAAKTKQQQQLQQCQCEHAVRARLLQAPPSALGSFVDRKIGYIPIFL